MGPRMAFGRGSQRWALFSVWENKQKTNRTPKGSIKHGCCLALENDPGNSLVLCRPPNVSRRVLLYTKRAPNSELTRVFVRVHRCRSDPPSTVLLSVSLLPHVVSVFRSSRQVLCGCAQMSDVTQHASWPLASFAQRGGWCFNGPRDVVYWPDRVDGNMDTFTGLAVQYRRSHRHCCKLFASATVMLINDVSQDSRL